MGADGLKGTAGNVGRTEVPSSRRYGSQAPFSLHQQNAQVSASFLCFNRTFPENRINGSSPPFPVTPILSVLSASVIYFWREVRTSPNQSPGFQDDCDNVVQFSVFTGVAESLGGGGWCPLRGGGTGLVVGSPSLSLPALPRAWGGGRSQALLKILQ